MDPETLLCLQRPGECDITDTEHLFAGIYFSFITTATLILDVLLIVIYCMLWNKLFGTVIYKLTLSLTIASIVNITTNFPVLIPCTYTMCTYLASDSAMIPASIAETFGYYTTLLTNCFIAIERISLFYLKSLNGYIARYQAIVIVLPWLFGAAVSTVTTVMGCPKRFNRWTLQYTFECGSCEIFSGVHFTAVLFFSCQTVVVIMLFGYIAIILRVCFGRVGSNNGRPRGRMMDAPLIVQFFIYCTFQWMSATFFYVAGPLIGYNLTASLVTNSLIIGNAGINAVLSLCFNKTIRHGFFSLLRCKWDSKLAFKSGQGTQAAHVVAKTTLSGRYSLPRTGRRNAIADISKD